MIFRPLPDPSLRSLMKTLSVGLALCLALPMVAQDRIELVDGTVIEGKVQSFDLQQLKYSAKGSSQSVPADRVQKVELGEFASVYKRGEASKLGGDYLVVARNKEIVSDPLMAQLGFVKGANLLLDSGRESDAFAALEEMQKEYPNGAMMPEFYRLKMETYLSKGPRAGRDAATVAGKYLTEATTGAWPQGFLLEAEFFKILGDAASGAIDPKQFQARLRDQLGKVQGVFPNQANRVNIQLANSLRTNGDEDGAAKIYEDLLGKERIDENSLAAAYLGKGLIGMAKAGGDKDAFRAALLDFLRVRLTTKNAWGSLRAEALYNAMLAAEKWQGEDWKYVYNRCRFELVNDFPNSEWAARAKSK